MKKRKREKARKRLAERIKVYNEICKRRQDNGHGYRRPGSLSGRKT